MKGSQITFSTLRCISVSGDIFYVLANSKYPEKKPLVQSFIWDFYQGSYRQVCVNFKHFSRTSKDFPTVSRTEFL